MAIERTGPQKANLVQILGSPVLPLVGGRQEVYVGANGDKTGYALTPGSYIIQTSMQRGVVSVPSGSSGTATPSAVVLAKAKLSYLGQSTGDNLTDARARLTRIALTGVTTITAQLNGNSNGQQDVSYELGEEP